ncbi:unnamed protein product [Meganyctiphanes norvegica]|uniref:Uncharacterized protein n=1 Tax=Meganyctiphanes norvegica TaxID=48144 RepID=A0AAV2S316_MEGNR
MASKAQFIIALLFGLVAVLYQIEVDPGTWEASERGNIYASAEQIEQFITNPDLVEKWFQWVSIFKAADSRPISAGKKYQAIYKLPFLGEYVMLMRVVEYKHQKTLVLESQSLLRPRFTIQLEESSSNATRLIFKLRWQRTSALFQWSVGPFLCFLTSQQLQHSLFMLKMMFPF